MSSARCLASAPTRGLVETGVLAVDGTKLEASASNRASRSYELPEHPASREGRRAWLREAKERLERERAANAEPVPRERKERLEIGRRRLIEDWRNERRANRQYEAYRGYVEATTPRR
jgi:hypothetical protein